MWPLQIVDRGENPAAAVLRAYALRDLLLDRDRSIGLVEPDDRADVRGIRVARLRRKVLEVAAERVPRDRRIPRLELAVGGGLRRQTLALEPAHERTDERGHPGSAAPDLREAIAVSSVDSAHAIGAAVAFVSTSGAEGGDGDGAGAGQRWCRWDGGIGQGNRLVAAPGEAQQRESGEPRPAAHPRPPAMRPPVRAFSGRQSDPRGAPDRPPPAP